jgi:rubrerythrin
MKEKFDSEILDFAIAREVGAYNFYMHLSEQQNDVVTANLFKALADEELEHKSKLQLEVMKQGRVVKTSGNWSRFEKEYPSIDVKDEQDISYRKALEIAIEREGMSFRLYADMAARLTDEQSRNMLFSLAEEEVSHKQKCLAQYKALIEWSG